MRARIGIVLAVLILTASSTAFAKPWRGGVELALGSYRSYAGPTSISGGGLGAAVFIERTLPKSRWALRAELTSEVFGQLTVRTHELENTIDGSGILAGGLWTGTSWRPRDAWVLTGALGVTRTLYFSSTSVADSDYAPGMLFSGEWFFSAERFWRLGVVGRLAVQLDPELDRTRVALTPTLGLRATFGR